jgi:hypothetical protein
VKKKTLALVLGVFVVVAFAISGSVMSDVEQAKYDVVEKYDHIEVRDYGPQLVAQVKVSGERQDAIKDGFKAIADYIFGNNTSQSKIAMTAPVTQEPSEKIAMTAPVMQQGQDTSWVVQFVMPASYSARTLPKPNNKRVMIKETPQKRFAVIRFSGAVNEEVLQDQTDQLNAFMIAKKMQRLSLPQYAFYNPPWTLPFLRRNEVMIEIKPNQ